MIERELVIVFIVVACDKCLLQLWLTTEALQTVEILVGRLNIAIVANLFPTSLISAGGQSLRIQVSAWLAHLKLTALVQVQLALRLSYQVSKHFLYSI